ncbi:MAG TPA: SpvB/TcaC N-terminal domain-containing protein [Ktedonosporobacter sp.]|jgi:RHS repeat-associated protein|nr:SpvB/TcaC N-terminal domain-containing protein [Ktedonosporobacter sp.]
MLAETPKNVKQDQQGSSDKGQISAPSISLPKGGGAIRGIGEKFAANPVTGTGSMTVPITTSPGRSGFGPQLSLSYDSGSGNGPFGFGWHLMLPSITRRTDRGLPQYRDGEESDVFLLSGAEDLVPILVQAGGQWQRAVATRTVDGIAYRVQGYRPRIEGLFSRIERWTELATGEIHWRSITKENITTLYGKDNNSRIFEIPSDNAASQLASAQSLGQEVFDPADVTHSQRIFTWLICASFDDKGNAIVYEYKAENSENIDLAQANESNRTPSSRCAQRYLKRVKYGNVTSHLVQPDLAKTDWLFELVLDYGEHDLLAPTPAEAQPWLCRNDPFSGYRSCFEVRTYRLCQRALMFHHFPNEPGVGQDCLVRSTDFTYQNIRNNPDDLKKGHPLASFIASVTQNGYKRQQDGSYLKKSLPPLEFAYSQPIISADVQELDAASLENLPAGLDGRSYRWVDLDGEGVSGILTEQAGVWFYKPNLGDGQFGPLETVAQKPTLTALHDGRQQLLSLAGDGKLALVDFSGAAPGFFKRTEDQQWENFATFTTLPDIAWQDANLRFVDLDGDGLADVLITEHEVFTWYASLGEAGFAPAQQASKPQDEERGPQLVFADGTQSIYLADMCGDGLTDLVRVRNGEICYWPNQGYGHFGSKVTMDAAPWFTTTELFDQQRVRLADIDGSGTADLIYLGADAIQVYFNQSGNSWSQVQELSPLPHLDRLSSVMTVDLLGNGTACLVWSSSLPGDTRSPVRYIDLMGGQKPHLLLSLKNNLGAETAIQYASSSKFYLADKLAGKPWITRLAFPVHVVERVETLDRISGNRFTTRYAYHHGYYDGFEREFRGFGMVEQWDTEELAALTASGTLPAATNIDQSSYVPPVLTRTWYHTGVFIDHRHISRQHEDEYYRESDLSAAQLEVMLLDDSILPTTIRLPDGTRPLFDLSGEEAQEACRALKGSLLRQEIYALDGTDAQNRPYSVSEHNYTIELLQPQGVNRHAVFFTHARESLDFHYERMLYPVNDQQFADPRVNHTLTLTVDNFGNVLQTVMVAYGRRYDDPDPKLSADDRKQQRRLSLMYREDHYTNAIQQDDVYRTPLLCETNLYELINMTPAANQPQVTNLFRFEEVIGKVQMAGDGQHELPYEDIDAAGATTSAPYRRLLERDRTLYRRDDMSAVLPLGQVQPMGLPFESYKLAFTPGLLAGIYQRKNGSVTEALLPDPAGVLGKEGSYLHSNDLKADGRFPGNDSDDHWWAPSGQVFYSPNLTDAFAQELAYASQHFFLAHRFRDPFGDTTVVTYDTYDLLLQETQDSLGNRITAGTRDPNGNLTGKSNDYRVLHPTLMMDANRNRSGVAFDVLGMVVGTAVMGKPEENLGDILDGFVADLTDAVISTHLQNPLLDPTGPLQGATTRIMYDLFAYQRTQNDAQPQSPVVYTVMRETHNAELTQGQQTKVQHSFSYSDGFGREIQKKVQAEPGPLVEGGPVISTRWVGSGWTIFNNKGNPVRKYEPFFSATHHFEFAVITGVSSTVFYDAMDRVVATLHPNHTYEKVLFEPWKQTTWDVNDTALLAPKADLDVSDFFLRLPDSDYLPTWYDQRQSGGLGAQEQAAAQKTAVHAGTPTLAYLDAQGRPFVTVAHNRFLRNQAPVDEYYATRFVLDIQGYKRVVSDAHNRMVMRYDYEMLGKPIHQASMEAGERWMLDDVIGNPVRGWDSRGHTLRTVYDVLRRPVEVHLNVSGGPELLVGRTVFGESQPTPEAKNLRGKSYQVFDCSGMTTNGVYDFKGNLLSMTRQLASNYKQTLDWSTSVALEASAYSSSTTYDALNREIVRVTPDNTVIHMAYNEAGLLESLMGNIRGTSSTTSFVTNIDYDARRQRVLIAYGNGTGTQYKYDPLTFRMTSLYTTRGASFPGDGSDPSSPPSGVQNLHYTYDPTGNITHIQDNAQQTIYFQNRRVEPSADYTYDAVYRLIEASGREHLGQIGGGGSLTPLPLTFDDGSRMHLLQPGDGNAMGRYLQQYTYDEVGNLLQMLHSGTDPAQPGWTCVYTYNEPSLLEAGKLCNRLSSTQISNGPALPYTYDVHGSMVTMPHLPLMQWDYKDRLQATAQQVVNNGGVPETTYYVYNANGQRVRKVTERQAAQGQVPSRLKERIYLGDFEVYREYGGDGSTVALERETLALVDGHQRVALIETRTQGSDPSPQQLIRYQFSNHLGSASLELDDQGQIITYEEYYPYGSTSYQAVRGQTETPKRYRYTGKERDEENALYYHGARYYAPWLGRWTAADPASIADGMNVYVYVGGNPVNLYDPNGKDKRTWINRGIGVLQVVGGGLEIAVGVGGEALPTGVTQVLGVVAIAHGGDTAWAGLRTIWTGEVQKTYTEQAVTAAAKGLGASDKTAGYIGAGTDFVVGVVPSMGVGLAKAAAVKSLTEGGTQLATHAAPDVAAQTATHAAPDVATQTATHAAPDVATQTATHAAPDAATQAATHTAPTAAAQTATHAAPNAAAHAAPNAAAHATPNVAAHVAPNAAAHAAPNVAAHAAPRAAAHLGESGLRVAAVDALQKATTRQSERLAQAILQKDVAFLRRAGLSAKQISHLLNPSSPIRAAVYGQAMEKLMQRSITSSPMLSRLFRYVANLRGIVAGRGRPDWIGRGVFHGILVDLTTNAGRAAHYARSYGEKMLVLTYTRPF